MPVAQLSCGNSQELHTKSVCMDAYITVISAGSQGENGREDCIMPWYVTQPPPAQVLLTTGSFTGWSKESCLTLCDPMDCSCQAPLSMKLSREKHWNVLPFPSLGTFLTQGSNLGLLHCRQILYRLRHWEPGSKTGQHVFMWFMMFVKIRSPGLLHIFFLIFKIMQIWWHIYRRLGKYRTRLHIVPLYITINFKLVN